MKKIYCELHIFDLEQNIYIIDPETGYKECVARATMEELPEILCAISNEKKLDKILLSGNSVFGAAIGEDIIAYSKIYYDQKHIDIEVLR